MRALIILMWKHKVVRQRMLLHTFLEFTAPLWFFFLMSSLREQIKPARFMTETKKPDNVGLLSNLVLSRKRGQRTYLKRCSTAPSEPNVTIRAAKPNTPVYISRLHYTTTAEDIAEYVRQMTKYVARVQLLESRHNVNYKEIIALKDITPPPRWIAYYPESVLTNTLMDEVGAKLDLKRLDFFPAHSERGYFPYSEGARLPDLATDLLIIEAMLIFQNMSGETWPDHLNYTIRMKGDFGMESFTTLDAELGPRKVNGLKYGTFMRIQWAVDTSYIKLLTGKEVPQVVSLQEFLNVDEYFKNRGVAIRLVGEFMRLLCWISLLLIFSFVLTRLLRERTSGIQELIQLVGVPLSSLRLSHVLNMLPVGLVFAFCATLIVKITDNPFIQYSSWILIVLLLLLYFNFVVSMAFLGSYLLRETQYAGSLSVLLYIVIWVPARALHARNRSYTAVLALGFLPNMPMYWFWKEVTAQEHIHSGADFSNMTETHTRQTASILMSYIYLLLQIAFCYTMTWYLSLVSPGKFGQALPWNFIFKPKYWRKSKEPPYIPEDNVITYNPRYFEPAPPNSVAGIKIVNVSKVYPQHQALKNVSLEVYKGDITVLLGHNGAGKTTLMNIITGMTSATHGKVYVMGKDTVTEKQEVRRHLGLCPQHNMFFGDLTVREHITFFTLLRMKNLSRKAIAEADMSTEQLAEKLGLTEKLNSMTSQLSGGMQRRVQLGCALAGGADVLVLDEPTSGLDVETRRELWDLLLSLRGDRTVLLTTHYMEEADALGDRVAAINNGVLNCFGTTMFLKKAVGTGYRLSFTTAGTPQEEAITRVLTSHVPDATLKERTINSLMYNVPVSDSGKFPKLFAALEAKRSQLEIESMGIGVATLEEVFMKLCSDIDTTLTEDEVDTSMMAPEVPLTKITGMHLYLRQFFVLLKRQAKYISHKKCAFVTMITMITNNEVVGTGKTSLPMDLDMYGDRADSRVMYHVEGPDVTRQDVDKVRRRFPKVTFEDTNDIATAVLKISKNDIYEYYLAGVDINQTNAKVLYTTIVRHTAPVALNLLSNMLASHYISGSDGKTITTINEPMSGGKNIKIREVAKGPINGNLWGLAIQFIMLFSNINSVSLPCKERETGTRRIHVMSGCPASLHWLSTMLFNATVCFLTSLVPMMLCALLLDNDSTINQANFLVGFTTVLILGSTAFMAFGYLVSHYFETKNTTLILTVWIFMFGMVFPSMKTTDEMITKNLYKSPTWYFLFPMRYLLSPYTLTTTVKDCISAARENANCKFFKKFCPHLIFEDAETSRKCCAGEDPRCYFCIIYEEPGEGIIILMVQLLVSMTLVILTERGLFNGVWDKLRNRDYEPSRVQQQSDMVRAEVEYVRKTIALPTKQIPDSLLANDLHKVYRPFLRPSVNACQGASFSVKKGECFGLLGVNGAGKSTIFKMITAEEAATRGKIFANGHFLTAGDSRYLKTLGYCPQFFGLDKFLTGEDNLEIILTLRGHDYKYVKEEVKNWIQIVGLERYARNNVESYSGGCMRRMGAAAALCSDADLSLLDEPSAGVDPAARRRLWTALRKALRRQRSIIISSHSMDEMEALCHRIAIMTHGRVRALGSPTALRTAHALGYAVVFKLAHAMPQDGAHADETLHNFKAKLHKSFDCSLRDEHVSMLNYHINETMRLSDLFNALESLRREFPTLIEDYSVSETTLEEVFLFFAKEGRLPRSSI